MSLYEGLKDVISIAQKADNVELYRMLIDLSKDALDLQNDLYNLTKENRELKELNNNEKKIMYHKNKPYITLENDKRGMQYCGTCWGADKKLVPYVDDRCIICIAKIKNGNRS